MILKNFNYNALILKSNIILLISKHILIFFNIKAILYKSFINTIQEEKIKRYDLLAN